MSSGGRGWRTTQFGSERWRKERLELKKPLSLGSLNLFEGWKTIALRNTSGILNICKTLYKIKN